MFEHSIRVPRHFKIAASIYKKVATEGGSVKTLLYDNKLRHFRKDVIYALVNESVKHTNDIDGIFESTSFLESNTRLDPWLARVLAVELLFGKKTLPGKSKPELTVLSYKNQFEGCIGDANIVMKKGTRKPRYIRVNTNLITTSDAIRSFQEEGYKFVRCTSGSYNDYLEQIKGLCEYSFTQDYHVKTVFVFPPGTKLHDNELYLENKIILQDKATAMAVHLLAPTSNSVTLDMCAAPGIKTTQLASCMKNEGKIYAIERDEHRYATLCEFVEKTDSKIVQTINKDVLSIKRGECDDVEYILLDPSCSGSGMELHLHNYKDQERLAKLTSLQEKFLKHAMNSFPNAKRIVYSTCSIYPEENERVVVNAVKTSRAKWRVQDVKELLKDKWNNFGSAMYGSMGVRCLYARTDSDLTTGFFLAVLDRDLKDVKCTTERNTTENNEQNKNIIRKVENKRNVEIEVHEMLCTSEQNENIKDLDEGSEISNKKEKKKKKHKTLKKQELANESNDTKEETQITHKKKKKVNVDASDLFHKTQDEVKQSENSQDNNIDLQETKNKKNKKNHKLHEQSENEVFEEKLDSFAEKSGTERRSKEKRSKNNGFDEASYEAQNDTDVRLKVKKKKRKKGKGEERVKEIDNEVPDTKRKKRY